MRTPRSRTPASQRFTAGVRPAGEETRVTTLLALLGAILVHGVYAGDPIVAVLAASLLLLPREFPFYRACRNLPPTVGAGLIGLSLLLPVFERTVFGAPIGAALAHLLLVLGVWRYQFRRLTISDHGILLSGAFALVLLSLTGPGPRPAAALAVYGFLAVLALFRLHLAAEEQRVLDLARVRGFRREEAEEVAGRSPSILLMPFMARLGLGVVLAGALVAWALPFAAEAAAGAWDYLRRGTDPADARDVLPEQPGKPVFAIPEGVYGPAPFGPRLDRDEFVRRLERQDRLVALVRRRDRGEDIPGLLLRGECYDFLTSAGRWIRARPRTEEMRDADDGETDGILTFPGPDAAAVVRDYLLPPGLDRTLLVVGPVRRVGRRRLLRDGTGNLIRVPEDRAAGYPVATAGAAVGGGDRIADVGPEFRRLPPGIDRTLLDGIVHPALMESEEPLERIEAIRRILAARCVAWEADRAPRSLADGGDAPLAFDPVGFLRDRRWGRNVDFATAYALLLRAAGIPCRLATGYLGGGEPPDADFRAFRTWHAFAWVEVPIDGVGWAAFDPTPERLNSLPEDALDRIFEAPPESRSAVAVTEVAKAKRPGLLKQLLDGIDSLVSSVLPGSPGTSGFGRAFSWILLLLVGGLALRALVGLLDRGARMVARRERGGPGAAAPPVPFYESLQRLLARHGMRRRRAQTPVEFAREVVERWGPELTDVARLTNAFCALRYGARRAPADRLEEYRRRVDAIRATLEERDGRPRAARVPAAAGAVALLLLVGLAGGTRAAEPAEAEALVESLGAPAATVRADAEAGLLALGRDALPALFGALRPEAEPATADEEVRARIRELDSEEYAVREAATAALVAMGERAVPALREAAESGSPEAARRSRRALAEIAGRAAAADAEVVDPSVEARRRREVWYLLGRIAGAPEVDGLLALALEDGGEDATRALAAVIRREPAVLDRLLARNGAPELLVVARAAAAAGTEAVRPALLRLVASPEESVREAAAEGLVTGEVIEATDAARLLLAQRELAAAEAELRRVLALCPGYPEAGVPLVELLIAGGRFEEAERIAEELPLPVAEREMLVARALAGAGDREAARARLMDAAASAPTDPEPLLRAAELDLGAEPQRTGAAVAALEKAAERAPGDARIWARLGELLGTLPDGRARAAECYRRALDLEPGNGDYEAGWVRYR